jgi:hypothetical protein
MGPSAVDPVAAAEAILREAHPGISTTPLHGIPSPRYAVAPPDVAVRRRHRRSLLDSMFDVVIDFRLSPWWFKALVFLITLPVVFMTVVILVAYGRHGWNG